MNARTGAIALLLLAGQAWSQDIYRCGDSYADQDCEGGQRIEAADERSAAQRAQAGQVARRDARLADRMERERLRRQALAEKALVRVETAGAKAARSWGRTEREVADAWFEFDADFVQPPELFIPRVPAKPVAPRKPGSGNKSPGAKPQHRSGMPGVASSG